jgi:hypothetical protein
MENPLALKRLTLILFWLYSVMLRAFRASVSMPLRIGAGTANQINERCTRNFVS